MANPFFSQNRFAVTRPEMSPTMTVQGAVNKALALVTLTLGCALFALNSPHCIPLMAVCAPAGLVLSLITIFKPHFSPITTPLYALAEGITLGGISAFVSKAFPGVALQAVLLTFGILLSMLGLYRAGFLRMTSGLATFLTVSTAGIALTYLLSFILGLFHIPVPLVHSTGIYGILFSVFVIIVASLGFIRDFASIEEGARQEAPAYMEWFAAFGLLLNLVWLYLEIIHLLSELQSED